MFILSNWLSSKSTLHLSLLYPPWLTSLLAMPTRYSEPNDVAAPALLRTKTHASHNLSQSEHITNTMTTNTTITVIVTTTTTITTTTSPNNNPPVVTSKPDAINNDGEETQSNVTCIPVSRPWLNRKAILQDLLQDMEDTGDINTLNSFLSNDIPFHGIGQVLLVDTRNDVQDGRKEEGHITVRDAKL